MKKRNLKQFKRFKTLQMSERTRNRRETLAGSLRVRFESNICMIEKAVWQDEKDFTLDCSDRTIVYRVKERNQISLMKI